jgi:high-affinity iron transporter
MLASLLICFREVLEAGLVVGIVLAATAGVPGRSLWVAGGVAAGVTGAAIVAAFASTIASALEGVGQEVFTASILGIAVVMLGWHNTWMARHGREMAAEMSAVGRAVKGGDKSLMALAVVVAVAVLREGSEVVLFLYGIAMSTKEGPLALLLGGVIGLCLAALLSWLLYRGLLVIPLRHLFAVTTWLIALLAAGMAGQAASVLAGADILPSWGDHLWNTSFILRDDSWIGAALHALIGYSAQPSGIQLAAYLATLLVLITLSRLFSRQPAARATEMAGSRGPRSQESEA